MYIVGMLLGLMALYLVHVHSELQGVRKRLDSLEAWSLRPPQCSDCGQNIRLNRVAMGELPDGWDIPRNAVYAAFARVRPLC